jgi:uncharacterized repeat protein (TIGR03837 family)
MPALLWDVYCRVIDNLGDAGVCWRLAAGLAARGQRVRLVIDDAAPLAFMAPGGAPGVEVMPWPGPAEPGDVVIEAFGCDPPPTTVEAMARRHPPPVWINLEYLSAEDYVERSHGLPSPQLHGPGRGLTKWFFFPGFTARTGGLLREPELAARRARFDRHAWLLSQGIAPRPGERIVTLFCYDNPAVATLLQDLASAPALLLLTPGPAQRQVTQAPPTVRLHAVPWLPQAEFDALLWSSDLNFVRGEDSLVRAIWAGAPFVWQAYPQQDDAHAAKLQALLQRMPASADISAAWLAWNGLGTPWPGVRALEPGPFQQLRRSLLAQEDLLTQLLSFVASRLGPGPGC